MTSNDKTMETWEIGEEVVIRTWSAAIGTSIDTTTVTAIRSHGAGKRTKVTTGRGVFSADGAAWERSGIGRSMSMHKMDDAQRQAIADQADFELVERFRLSRERVSNRELAKAIAGVLREYEWKADR